MRLLRSLVLLLVVLGALGGVGWLVYERLQEPPAAEEARAPGRGPAPVEVAEIERGRIELRRTFSGTLEPRAAFVVAPKVGGRITRVAVDLADPVRRGQVVVQLDDDEHQQAVAQAAAEVAVARAKRVQAEKTLEIANRALQRVETLRERGVTSESQLDTAKAEQLAAEGTVEVASAEVTRAEAALEAARIRLGYTSVSADWTGGEDRRMVSERHADEGDTVSANTPLLSIVEIQPILAVIHVTEADYGRLQVGQEATLTTDAYPGEAFEATVERVAPVFGESTRQARVELEVDNPRRRLKPGMFVRVTVVLHAVEDATVVPEAALTLRADRPALFVVSEDGTTVSLRFVRVGIRQGDRVQVEGEGLAGRVVTLGHQLVDDGSAIVIPSEDEAGRTRADDGLAPGAGGPE